MKMENPNQMWIFEDDVYKIKTFGAENKNLLFNVLPNTPYLTNGNKVIYVGFLEGYGGTSIFSDTMLFVALKGVCKTEKRDLYEKQACFGKEITCESGSIVLVFAITTFYRTPHMIFGCRQECIKNNLVMKYRIYGQYWGENKFFAIPSLFRNVHHVFSQITQNGHVRGCRAGYFPSKTVLIHHGKLHMKTYFPAFSTVVDLEIEKTPEFYELYHFNGEAYHSFLANTDNTLNTILVTEPFGTKSERFPLYSLWKDKEFICGSNDFIVPTSEQMSIIDNANFLKL